MRRIIEKQYESITKVELIILLSMYVLIFVGFVISLHDLHYFVDSYVAEDEIVENLTAIGLAVAGIIVALDIWKKRKVENVSKLWIACRVLFALALLFGAGEEISWGQRIFEIPSSIFFKENNAQAETNLHNMVVGDVKLNKLIFGKILTVGLFAYFILLPILEIKLEFIKRMISTFGIPLPNFYNSIVFISGYLITLTLPTGRKWEMAEMCLAFVLVAIVYHSYAVKKMKANAINLKHKNQ